MTPDAFDAWISALEQRHLAELRLAEVTRALRSLSANYVERRDTVRRGAALASAGKRAAFALFYAPLHFLTVQHIVRRLGLDDPAPSTIVDLGCGTGVAGAAWALECANAPRVVGIERHPAAVEEARWTYRLLGIDGSARQGDATRVRLPRGEVGVVVAYLFNELPPSDRNRIWTQLQAAARRGTRALIVEPIARQLTTAWWPSMALDAERAGGRADEWRFSAPLPAIVERLDRAAGLNHREITARSILL